MIIRAYWRDKGSWGLNLETNSHKFSLGQVDVNAGGFFQPKAPHGQDVELLAVGTFNEACKNLAANEIGASLSDFVPVKFGGE